MLEKKIKINFPPPAGPLVDATDVPVKESTERWTEIVLEDGSTIRIKPTILGAVRVEGQYDQEGNPMYLVKSSLNSVVANCPAHLRKGAAPKGVN